MCKHHDQFHYPAELRRVASILAGGRPELRDALLLAAAWAGLQVIAGWAWNLTEVERAAIKLALATMKDESAKERELIVSWVEQQTEVDISELEDIPW